jgi:hypothetical protein
VRVFLLSIVFGKLHNGDAVIELRGLHESENFSVKPIGARAAGELRRATCNLCTKSTFAVGSRRTMGNLRAVVHVNNT